MSDAVVVTGAASGIGRAIADVLRAAGREVIGIDRDECDLADAAAVTALAGSLGGVADLVNCAGVPGTHPVERIVAVNLLAPRRLARELSPTGTVINVASVAAGRSTVPDDVVADLLARDDEDVVAWAVAEGLDGTATYDFTKKALLALTLAQCAERLGSGRRALSVSPGPTTTPILADFEASMGADRMRASADLVGRHATPADVAALVGFLLTPEATWTNGVDIRVDGGLIGARNAPVRD